MPARRRRETPVTGVAAISVAVPCQRWLDRIPGARTLARKAASAALEVGAEGTLAGHGAAEVSLVLGDDDFVRTLNRTYRRRDEATNVLAFANVNGGDTVDPAPSGRPTAAIAGDVEKPVLLGDVVIAYETAVAEARAEDKSIDAHLCHLVVHGVLHLLGYDHEDETDALRMESIETKVLGRLGLPDPYRLDSVASD